MENLQNGQRGVSLLKVVVWIVVIGFIALVVQGFNAARAKGREARAQAEQGKVEQTNNAASNEKAGSIPLEVTAFKCGSEHGYVTVTGQVKNVSDKPMKDVVAVGSWHTLENEFVKSADSLIEYNPILPGQTSPFEVLTTGNPAIGKCAVEFKEFFGGTIPSKRSTQ